VHPLGAGTVWLHQNVRGDVVAATSDGGAIVERRFYDDYGNVFDEAKQPVVLSIVGNPYGFQGRRLDAETGLYYFRNRFYDASTGRFLQRDPVWDAGNVGGQYTFVGCGPVSRRDALGLWDEFAPKPGASREETKRQLAAFATKHATVTERQRSLDRLKNRQQRFEAGVPANPRIAETVDFGVSFVPGLNDLKDVQEGLTGRNLVTGERLNWLGRTASLAGVIFGSGSFFRSTFKTFDVPTSYLDDLEDFVPFSPEELTRLRKRTEGPTPRQLGAPDLNPSVRGMNNPKTAAAAERGRKAHSEFKERVKAKEGWQSEPRLTDPETGRTVIPDAVSPSGRPVELKPNTPSGRRRGQKQLEAQERAARRKGRVVYHDQ
jgi:RHS repeat-associated protein